MWKITTCGFTLQEVLILAAMNIATAVIEDEKRGQGAGANGEWERPKSTMRDA
jgi:hypothetical protein